MLSPPFFFKFKPANILVEIGLRMKHQSSTSMVFSNKYNKRNINQSPQSEFILSILNSLKTACFIRVQILLLLISNVDILLQLMTYFIEDKYLRCIIISKTKLIRQLYFFKTSFSYTSKKVLFYFLQKFAFKKFKQIY